MVINDRKIKTKQFPSFLSFVLSIKSFLPSSVWPIHTFWVVISTWGRQIVKHCRSREQTKLSMRNRSTGHNLQTSLHLPRLKGFMETVRATPHSPLTRLLPCTHYNAMKTKLRHGSSLRPNSRPPGISQSAVMMSDLQLSVSLFPAHSMPTSPFSLQVCEPMLEWARVNVAMSVFKQARPGIDLP